MFYKNSLIKGNLNFLDLNCIVFYLHHLISQIQIIQSMTNKTREISPSRSQLSNLTYDEPDNDGLDYPGETKSFISATTDMSHISINSKDENNFVGDRHGHHHNPNNVFYHQRSFISKFFTCDPQYFTVLLISLICYSTPILFILIPLFQKDDFENVGSDSTDCQTQILTIIIKLVSLSIASYFLFWKKSRIIYARPYWPRILCLGLLLTSTLIYWLFYCVKVLNKRQVGLKSAILFAQNATETLFYIHVLAILVIELRLIGCHIGAEKQFLVEMIRAGDGEQFFYNLNQLTIQEAAFLLLQNYYRDFPLQNLAALSVPSNKKKSLENLSNNNLNPLSGLANMQGLNDSTTVNNTQANIINMKSDNHDQKQNNIVQKPKNNRENDANERYYQSLEHERHCRKRKCRLELAVQSAFNQILVERYSPTSSKTSKTHSNNHNNLVDSNEAATVLFPSIARPLQKYLRTTRQHSHYSLASTTNHLSQSFKHGLSYRAFLARYTKKRPEWLYSKISQNFSDDDDDNEIIDWNLLSEEPLTSNIKKGTFFTLINCSGEVSLYVQVNQHPRIQITEIFSSGQPKFSLKVNQTAV